MIFGQSFDDGFSHLITTQTIIPFDYFKSTAGDDTVSSLIDLCDREDDVFFVLGIDGS